AGGAMTDPGRALEEARAAAATMRAQGAYADEDQRDQGGAAKPAETLENLFEWAMIDPDLREVRSTRRFGAPVTLLKLGLVRLLNQYHAELIAQQTRFNVHVLGHVRRLETRIEELERIVGAREHERERPGE
ncbi:MAG TPA: hypothetical protein VG186_07575, partial [Solirubrobacteraceae bacterium]|nr:hypothetical protein [Solirubrobacteraceae bacterium]